jgi:hypothetical protein
MRLDDFLPDYEFRERHDMLVRAEPQAVYGAIKSLDLSRSLVVRFLFALRSLPGRFRPSRSRSSLGLTLPALLAGGFTILADEPPEELVFGIVGRFWRLSGGGLGVAAEDFKAFAQPGYAKAAANFLVVPASDGRIRLSTETRIHCTNGGARLRFRFYWIAIRPFSGLVRRAMLRSIREAAERPG